MMPLACIRRIVMAIGNNGSEVIEAPIVITRRYATVRHVRYIAERVRGTTYTRLLRPKMRSEYRVASWKGRIRREPSRRDRRLGGMLVEDNADDG